MIELTPLLSIQILCLTLLAILFLQSGLDKVFDYKGNLSWLQGHFAKSPLANTVGLLLPTITILEVAAGICSAVGIFCLICCQDPGFGIIGAQLSALSLLALFFGQRIAKDYPGAGSLVPYFLVCMVTLFALSM